MNIKDRLIGILSILTPYIVVALLVNQIGGLGMSFWLAIAILLGARMLFFVMDIVSSSIVWRFYRRRIFTDWVLTFLQKHEFPKERHMYGHIMRTYLARIVDDRQAPTQLRLDAQHLEMSIFNCGGIADKYQNANAAEDALNIYAPQQDSETSS